jgi:hypothetical protein
MGNRLRKTLASGFVLLLLVALGGCSSVMDGVAGTSDLLGKTKARVNQAALDAVGVGALEDAVLASLIYSQVFFAGGYGAGYGDFEEGEGVAWDVTARDDDGSETVRIERALLKRNADGSAWWLLRYSAEGEDDFLSEALMSEDYDLLTFRYMDPETDRIREWIPEQEEAEDKSVEDDEAEEMAGIGFYEGSFGQYIVGSEKVTVPAGTYLADHILIEDTYTAEEEGDESQSYEVRYEWWLGSEVPGQLIKYIWANTSDGSSLSGVLVSNKKGYTTELGSF